MSYLKKLLRAIWEFITWPYYKIKQELAYRKKIKELKKLSHSFINRRKECY